MSHRSLPSSVYVLLGLMSLGWGFNWPMMKIAVSAMPPFTFRALCVMAGAAGLFAIARANSARLRVPDGEWPRLMLIALTNVTLWNMFTVYGVYHLPSGRAAVLAFTMPVWTVLLSVPILGERLTVRRILGVALGSAAVLLLLGDDLLKLGAAPIGLSLMLLAALSWALGTVLLKRYPLGLSTSAMVGWQFVVGGIPIVLAAMATELGDWRPIGPAALFALIYNLLVAVIFCHWAWFKIVAVTPASVAALSTLMIPVIGVVSGMLVLGEKPGWQEFGALALVLGAMATVLLPSGGRQADSDAGRGVRASR